MKGSMNPGVPLALRLVSAKKRAAAASIGILVAVVMMLVQLASRKR
jgi:hypothetical protein